MPLMSACSPPRASCSRHGRRSSIDSVEKQPAKSTMGNSTDYSGKMVGANDSLTRTTFQLILDFGAAFSPTRGETARGEPVKPSFARATFLNCQRATTRGQEAY